MPKPQDMMGSFLGPGNMGQPEPFLHAARSPSPTLQPTSLGKACNCCSAAHSPSTLVMADSTLKHLHINMRCVFKSAFYFFCYRNTIYFCSPFVCSAASRCSLCLLLNRKHCMIFIEGATSHFCCRTTFPMSLSVHCRKT